MEQESQSSTRREFLRNAAAAGLSLGVLSGWGPEDRLIRSHGNSPTLEASKRQARQSVVE